MSTEHERYNLNPQQFAEYKQRAEARGGSVRVPGTNTYIPASKESKEKRQKETQDFHASLVPMKKTLNESGSSYGRLSQHLVENGHLIGAPKGRRNAIIWARDLHDKNPQEFIQKVGLKTN